MIPNNCCGDAKMKLKAALYQKCPGVWPKDTHGEEILHDICHRCPIYDPWWKLYEMTGEKALLTMKEQMDDSK